MVVVAAAAEAVVVAAVREAEAEEGPRAALGREVAVDTAEGIVAVAAQVALLRCRRRRGGQCPPADPATAAALAIGLAMETYPRPVVVLALALEVVPAVASRVALVQATLAAGPLLVLVPASVIVPVPA